MMYCADRITGLPKVNFQETFFGLELTGGPGGAVPALPTAQPGFADILGGLGKAGRGVSQVGAVIAPWVGLLELGSVLLTGFFQLKAARVQVAEQRKIREEQKAEARRIEKLGLRREAGFRKISRIEAAKLTQRQRNDAFAANLSAFISQSPQLEEADKRIESLLTERRARFQPRESMAALPAQTGGA